MRRLAQRFQHVAAEFRQFVEKEDAIVDKADFTEHERDAATDKRHDISPRFGGGRRYQFILPLWIQLYNNRGVFLLCDIEYSDLV